MNKQIKQPSVPLYREVKFSGLSFDWQQNCEQSSVDEMNACTLELRVLGRRPAIFSEQTCFIRAQTTCRKECNANLLACFFSHQWVLLARAKQLSALRDTGNGVKNKWKETVMYNWLKMMIKGHIFFSAETDLYKNKTKWIRS